MSENETIWRATDNDGRCWLYGEKPDWSEHQFYSQDGRVLEYYGTEKPPPGEFWEIVQMRKGDIDTDGEPIGWKIVGIGKDGSVLCEKGNGQRRRYSFERKGEQPTGEAWERLLNVVADYARNVGIVGPRGETIKEAWKAYEAAQSAEPQRPKIVCLCGSTRFAKEFADANERETLAGNIVLSVGCFRRTAPDGQREPMEESVKAALDVLHKRKIDLADEVLVLNVGGYIGDSTRSEIEHARKTGKRVRYLEPGRTPTAEPPASPTEVSAADQVKILEGMLEDVKAERDRTIAELREQIHKLKVEAATQTDAISEREDRIDQLSGEVQRLTAKLERPEMPEVVRELLAWFIDNPVSAMPIQTKLAAVRDHYAPPLKFEVGGVYIREPYGHDELELLKILDDRMLFYLRSYSEVAWTDSKGQTNGWKIIKRVR